MFIEDIDRFFEEQKKTQKIQAFDIDPTATEKAKAYTDACAFAEKHYGKMWLLIIVTLLIPITDMWYMLYTNHINI